jgi:hypothetical protein
MCVCSLSYPACKAHAPYYVVICDLSGSTKLLTLFHKGHDFRKKKLLNIKCVFWFSVQLLSETFLSLRIIESNITMIYIGLHLKYPSFFSDFNEICICSTDFRKILKCQFSRKSIRWESNWFLRKKTQKRTDRHDEASSRFSQFREHA